mmetsp:Transcript_26781/g.54134  ORF Transcript_26781/g.54134 Transcript_26781/m.54134 type:complete len:307 (+) Transcript_26781:59-979(+)
MQYWIYIALGRSPKTKEIMNKHLGLSAFILSCFLAVFSPITAFRPDIRRRPVRQVLHKPPKSCNSISVAPQIKIPAPSSQLKSASNDEYSETEKLLEKARQLRDEVSSLQSSKLQAQELREKTEQSERQRVLEEQRQKEEIRMRYSAVVPILKDMGEEVMERVDFPPRIIGGKSRILTIQSPLPLGILLGSINTDSFDSSNPMTSTITTIDEITSTSNAYVAGARQNDIVRAITACQTTMTTPTWQLLAGGIGQPKIKRFIYGVDGRPLEEVMEAVGSNRMDAEGRDVWLVLERVDESEEADNKRD